MAAPTVHVMLSRGGITSPPPDGSGGGWRWQPGRLHVVVSFFAIPASPLEPGRSLQVRPADFNAIPSPLRLGHRPKPGFVTVG